MGSSSDQGCCVTFTKVLFIFFNVLFFIIGAASFGVGIWAAVSDKFAVQVMDLLSDKMKVPAENVKEVVDLEMIEDAAILIIVAGAVVMILGFLGCLGAWKEVRWMLVAFFIILFLILGLLIAGAVLITGYPKIVEKNFQPYVAKLIDQWSKDHKVNSTIDFIQETLECCGGNGPSDYPNTRPSSCQNYTVGCAEKMRVEAEKLLDENIWMVGGIGIGVIAIIIIGMILSMVLCCKINSN